MPAHEAVATNEVLARPVPAVASRLVVISFAPKTGLRAGVSLVITGPRIRFLAMIVVLMATSISLPRIQALDARQDL